VLPRTSGRPAPSSAGAWRAFATLIAVTTRRIASAALALAAVLTLGACATRSPMQTTEPYSPADGVPVDLGSVQVRGLVIVSKAKGEPGQLVGQVVNNATKAARLTITTAGGSPVELQAQPGSTTLGTDEPVSLGAVGVVPGSMVRVQLTSDAGGSAQATVPVLSPTGYYSTITPTATTTPTATDSATPTATDSATPTATDSATPTATASTTAAG
jgi:hypothetical protein